jgi:hypothetical protein
MPYTIIYQVAYQDVKNGEVVRVNITDTDSFTSDPITEVPIVLEGGESPFHVSVVDNDRDKFTPIRAKVAEINIIPTDTVNAETFASGADDRWLVNAYVESTGYVLFKGFLVMDDFQKPFLPVSHKREFTLTATDNLGTLKEIELTDFDGERIFDTATDMHSFLMYILYALKKTNLELNVVICSTWFEESQTVFECAWENNYPSHKSFEAGEPNKKVDCYTALEMIARTFLCSVFQRGGKWWIKAIDESVNNPTYMFEYQPDGTFVSNTNTTSLTQTIGKTNDIKLILKDALVNYVRPVKFVRVNLNYEYPLEIVDNIDFSRGIDDILVIVVDMTFHIFTYANLAAFPTPGEFYVTYKALDTGLFYRYAGSYEQVTGTEIPTGVAYVWEDWTVERVGGGTVNAAAYIAKVFQHGEEIGRHGVLGTSTNPHKIVSNPVPVGKYDRFAVSVDRRLSLNLSGSGVATEFVMQIVLDGEDGSTWKVQADGNWSSTIDAFITTQYNRNSTNERDWMNVSVDVKPVPVNGTITIALMQSQFHTSVQTHFSNLQFNYQPYLNGSYQKYKGHYNEVSQAGEYKANVEIDTPFGDSPKPLFKNTIFKKIGTDFIRTGRWYAAGDLLNQAITPPIPDQYLHPLGHLQVYALWNQYFRRMVVLNGTLRGLRLDTLFVPDLIEAYEETSGSADTTNKTFMLISYEQDSKRAEWTGTLSEVYDSAAGKDYASPHTFNYKGGDI